MKNYRLNKNSGLLFPKPDKKKKAGKKHKASILQERDGRCYLCMKLNGDPRYHGYLEEHHIFGGPNRGISEAEGFKVYLCLLHHRNGPEAVHNNAGNMRIIQKDAQKTYEETHTRKDFMNLIRKNYLEEEDKLYQRKQDQALTGKEKEDV